MSEAPPPALECAFLVCSKTSFSMCRMTVREDPNELMDAQPVGKQRAPKSRFGYLEEEEEQLPSTRRELGQLQVGVGKAADTESSVTSSVCVSPTASNSHQTLTPVADGESKEGNSPESANGGRAHAEQAPAPRGGAPEAKQAAAPREAAPEIMLVTSPKHAPFCAGVYLLDTAMRPNGQPIWKQKSGKLWLYQSPNDRWYIGGVTAEKRNFQVAAGFLRHGEVCSVGALPHHMEAGHWEWGDSSRWYADPGISVAPMLPGEVDRWEREHAQPEKEAPLREKVRLPSGLRTR